MNVYYWRMLMLDVLCWISPPQPYENLLCQYLKKSYLIHVLLFIQNISPILIGEKHMFNSP